MELLNMNELLDRNEEEAILTNYLNYFEENKKNLLTKRGIYIFGAPGTGKTVFVKNILKNEL